jgi:hypothetical protein
LEPWVREPDGVEFLTFRLAVSFPSWLSDIFVTLEANLTRTLLSPEQSILNEPLACRLTTSLPNVPKLTRASVSRISQLVVRGISGLQSNRPEDPFPTAEELEKYKHDLKPSSSK